MAQTSQTADHHEKRWYSIGERLLRFGLQPAETVPLEPAALEAVLAFRNITLFIGLATPTLVPGVMANRDATGGTQAALRPPACCHAPEEALARS